MSSQANRHHKPAMPLGKFFVPNKLTLKDIVKIEQELGAQQQLCWILEDGLPARQDIYQHFSTKPSEGFMFSPTKESPTLIAQRITAKLKQNKHVIFLPTRPRMNSRCMHDYDSATLNLLDKLALKIEPIFCGENGKGDPNIHYLNRIEPSPASSAHLLSAWMEGSAAIFETSPALATGSLAKLLIEALMRHDEALIINGIDGNSIYYSQMLKNALWLARHLKRNYSTSTRIGILLPPGADAICANLACIFAGLCPVNLNYHQTPEACQAQAKQVQLKRYITQVSTCNQFHKQTWLNHRDFIYLDKVLEEERKKKFQFSHWRTTLGSAQSLLKWIDYKQPDLAEEALIVYSLGQEDVTPKPISLTHKQVLAQILQLQQAPTLVEPSSTLSRHSYHLGAGLILGFILPILAGQHIITYPDDAKLDQFIRLIAQHKVQLASIHPEQLYKLLQTRAKPKQLASLKYLIVSGAPLQRQMQQHCTEHWGVEILNAYSISKACAFISLSNPNEASTQQQLCPTGQPLRGVALRIGNPHITGRNIALGQLGSLWMKGPITNSQEWIATGDIASLAADGQLCIYGRRQRFSRIDTQLVPHQKVEQLLYQFYQIKQTTQPQLAVVSINTHDREQLILLSAIHKDFSANDYITLRYGLSNLKYPREWCPNKVLPISRIPLLSNGELDYQQCCTLSQQALGNK